MRETASLRSEPLGSLAQRWKELHTAVAQLAKAADLAPQSFDSELAAFPAMLNDATEWQRELAWQAVEDIDAMMRPGLAAIGTINSRGQNPTAPALALWREFFRARETVLALVEPEKEAIEPV